MEELEIMRQQIEAMKQQLDTQQIVNKDLLRKVMRGRASWLNRFVKIEIVMLPILYLFYAAVSVVLGVSQWYALVLLVMCVIDVVFDWRFVRIPPAMFGTASILDLKKFLLRQKKWRAIEISIMLPLAVIWVTAFSCAIKVKNYVLPDGAMMQPAMAGGIVAGVIGGLIGVISVVIIFRKMQRTNDALLRDIRDLENDE